MTEQQLGRFARKLNLLARKDRVVVFAGSLPANMGVARFREIVEACVLNGARVVVESDADAMEAVRDLRLWLIKPSVQRLSAMVGASVSGEPVSGEREIVRYGLELLGEPGQVVLPNRLGGHLTPPACLRPAGYQRQGAVRLTEASQLPTRHQVTTSSRFDYNPW